MIHKKYNFDISNNYTNNGYFVLVLELKNQKNNDNNNIDCNIFENLEFPLNVNSMTIQIACSINIQNFLLNKFNLPYNLSQLKIISPIPLDLSNLSTNLILLDISESDYTFNLDYLHDSIKILYSPNFS